jgi:hypoxanthine phosphoribosyltransferase
MCQDSKVLVVDDIWNCGDDARACKEFAAAHKLDAFTLQSLRGDWVCVLRK